MAYQTAVGNPFMLMLNPEIVLAAIESSERLSQLDRRLCRPLDRHVGPAAAATAAADEAASPDDFGGEPAHDER